MNLLLIDDHFCAREGVACLLKQIIPQLNVFEAESFDDGLVLAKQTPLNLVMLDVQLPGKDGLAGLAEMKEAFPDLCVVMFSGVDDSELVFQALRLGAMGFIVKSVSRQAFVDALRDVLAGKVYLPASAVGPRPVGGWQALTVTDVPKVSDPVSLGLTPKQFEVLTWLVQGIGNKQIARHLGVGDQNVRNHLRVIYQKFGVAKRTELLVKVFERGIVFGKPGVGN